MPTVVAIGMAAIARLRLWRECGSIALNQAHTVTSSMVLFGELEIAGALVFDSASLCFLFTVSVISLAVIVFSKSYILNEKFGARFHLIVVGFVVSIIVLILSPNLLMVLLG